MLTFEELQHTTANPATNLHLLGSSMLGSNTLLQQVWALDIAIDIFPRLIQFSGWKVWSATLITAILLAVFAGIEVLLILTLRVSLYSSVIDQA